MGSGIPYNPASALRYTVTANSADSQSDVSQRFESVQTLANQSVFMQMYGSTLVLDETITVAILVNQNFGVGGSSTVTTAIGTFTYTFGMTPQSISFTVPSIGGNTIGTGSYLEIVYRFNPNLIQDVIITNGQFQSGPGTALLYPYLTENEQYAQILPEVLAGYGSMQGTNIIGWSATQTLNQMLNLLEYSNYLIGWDFSVNPNQFGQAINSTTPIMNNNATYIADQTILQSQGDNIVSKNSFIGEPLALTVVTANAKFGIGTIVEARNCYSLLNSVASICAQMYTNSTHTVTMGISILGWTGTAYMETKQMVAAFNAATVTPTLNSDWIYLSGPTYFILGTTPNSALFKVKNIDITGVNSIGVMVWIDSGPVVSDVVYFEKFGLCEGENIGTPPNIDFGTSLIQCQRYYQRSYEWPQVLPYGAITNTTSPSVNPLVATNNGITLYPAGASLITMGASQFFVEFPVEMAQIPDINLYNPFTGIADTGFMYISPVPTLTSGTQNVPIEAYNGIGDPPTGQFYTGFNMVTSQTTADFTGGETVNYEPLLYFHYTADATLGV